MNRKIRTLALMILSGVLLGGCTAGNQSNINVTAGNQGGGASVSQLSSGSVGKCKEEAVTIEGYGDKGRRLQSCFVQYPGEPSRQDKSYYVVEDICRQFTKEFVQNALGKPIIKAIPPKISSLYNCEYTLNEKDDYVMLVLEYLSIENQKKGHEMAGRHVEVSDKIPMRNMVVWQPDGLVNSIYLVLGDEKFISIERTSGSGLTADELIAFAGNIAKEIKDFK